VNLELTDEQQALRATVRRCLTEEAPIADVVRPVVDGARWAPDRAWKRLAEVGALGVLAPVEAGGTGLGMVDAAIVAEELGRALYPGPWVASAVAAVRALAATDGDTLDLLAAVASGEVIAALALPGDGDVALGGDALVGAVAHVLGAPLAGTLLVPAGGRLFAVQGPGVDADPSVDPTTSTGSLQLAGAAGTLVGELPAERLAEIRDDVIVARAADALGSARAAFELAVEHAKVRHQFGQPIGAFQAVQHLCVDLYETVELLAGGVLHAAWAADAAGPDERHLAAVRLLAFSDRLATVGDGAIQVLGGIGFTWEHDAHLHLRRLLAWSTAFGPASRARIELGRSLTERGRPEGSPP
jgi:acyl-CoA dehydrogenase